MARLAGKVAVITGAAQGMGEAHARGFVAEGAKVIMTDLNADAGTRIAQQLGPNAHFVKHDVSSEAGWAEVVAEAQRRYGNVTVLVNNAGIVGPPKATHELTLGEFSMVCGVNQTGVFLGMKHCVPSMLRAGGGSIVNISSISGIVIAFGTPNLAYAASKFAVRGLTKFAALEYAAHGIRVNSIHPGYILTPMAEATLDEEAMKAACAAVPLKRMAKPSEVTELAIFLASDSSSFITGAEHIIDGGLIQQ
jgi:3alpha(or 20beta)-hydroxysteroid dehydrogenase